MSAPRIVLGIAGASGAALGLSVAKQLSALGAQIDLVTSNAAKRTIGAECGPDAYEHLTSLVSRVHPVNDIGASIASGSVPVFGMIIAPCSMRSLAAISHGLDDNLLIRAATVQLKERRKLILLARESPLTLAHLRNMTQASEMGAIIMPPAPAFYLSPQTVHEIVEQIAARAIDLLGIAKPIAASWKGKEQTVLLDSS